MRVKKYLVVGFLFFLVTESVVADVFIHPSSNKQLKHCLYKSIECYRGGKRHAGIDYSKHGSRDIVASNDGVIARVEFMSANDHGMGNNVIIQHELERGGFVYSTYSHLDSIDSRIKKGVDVKRGQKIGVMGGSGKGKSDLYGIHLHFEIKSSPVTHAPNNSSVWGYVKEDPSDLGYYDPNAFIGKVSVKKKNKVNPYGYELSNKNIKILGNFINVKGMPFLYVTSKKALYRWVTISENGKKKTKWEPVHNAKKHDGYPAKGNRFSSIKLDPKGYIVFGNAVNGANKYQKALANGRHKVKGYFFYGVVDRKKRPFLGISATNGIYEWRKVNDYTVWKPVHSARAQKGLTGSYRSVGEVFSRVYSNVDQVRIGPVNN